MKPPHRGKQRVHTDSLFVCWTDGSLEVINDSATQLVVEHRFFCHWNFCENGWLLIDYELTRWICHSRLKNQESCLSWKISECHRNIECLGLLSGVPKNNWLTFPNQSWDRKSPKALHSLDSFSSLSLPHPAKVYDDVNPMWLGKATRNCTYKHKGSKHYGPW